MHLTLRIWPPPLTELLQYSASNTVIGWNTQQNNIWFLPGTATHVNSIIVLLQTLTNHMAITCYVQYMQSYWLLWKWCSNVDRTIYKYTRTPASSLVPLKKKTAWQLTRVQTVDFHCLGVYSTNQISECFMWQLKNFSCIITWNNGFVQSLFADLCATTTVPVDKLISLQTRTCSRVEV